MEFNTIKDLLQSTEQRLIEAQASITERQKEIEVDLADCRKALAALDHVPDVGKTMERVPKAGDVLVCIKQDFAMVDVGDEVLIISIDEVSVTIQRKDGSCAMYINTGLRKYFRFKDEEPTPATPIHEARQQAGEKIDLAKSVSATSSEYLANLHSFQHVNQEPKKKPYRIKTRNEMIVGECFVDENESIWVSEKNSGLSFEKDMSYLHGHELDTDQSQIVGKWIIEPWMITENN